MTAVLSQNTQAILLLTAPLIVGRGQSSPDLLSPGEYKRLAKHLWSLKREPGDLLAPEAAAVREGCRTLVDIARLERLLDRGFLLSQAIERWQTRAIWVVSRADPDYPKMLKSRVREDAPAVIYGCGDVGLLDGGGLAVVGSRHVDEMLIDETMAVGRLAAKAGKAVVSGGAKGIDQAAMRGALDAGGRVAGVLANNLERAAMQRDHREPLLDGQLVLMSPYDPNAGFKVGNAMQRNKLIYALADAALVVSSDLNKGGTWTGAKEQLDKLKFVPVFVRSTGAMSPGLNALQEKGALPWPNPSDAEAFERIFTRPQATGSSQASLALPTRCSDERGASTPNDDVGQAALNQSLSANAALDALAPPASSADGYAQGQDDTDLDIGWGNGDRVEKSDTVAEQPSHQEREPKDVLFDSVCVLVEYLLSSPKQDNEIADALDVTPAQTKTWLKRMVSEGRIKKLSRPVRYVADKDLLDELSDG